MEAGFGFAAAFNHFHTQTDGETQHVVYGIYAVLFMRPSMTVIDNGYIPQHAPATVFPARIILPTPLNCLRT